MSVGFGAVLAAAFILGFAAETGSLYDEFWSSVLLLGALVVLLTAALAASLGCGLAISGRPRRRHRAGLGYSSRPLGRQRGDLDSPYGPQLERWE